MARHIQAVAAMCMVAGYQAVVAMFMVVGQRAGVAMFMDAVLMVNVMSMAVLQKSQENPKPVMAHINQTHIIRNHIILIQGPGYVVSLMSMELQF
jgi:hypothetical protein